MRAHATAFAERLSWAIAGLMLLASASGLLLGGTYRDNVLVTAAFRGNDLVTLALALPLLVWSLTAWRRGSQRGALVWLGLLAYTLYNYAFYLFGAAFNRLFLVYALLFTLSVGALISAALSLPLTELGRVFGPRTPARGISVFIALFALLLASLWLSRILGFVVSGEVPTDILATGHPTGVVYALDLTLLVPALAVAAVLLWKRRPEGFVLATVMMIKATTYSVALIAMSPFAARAGVADAWALTPLWAVLGAGTAVSMALLLWNLNRKGDPHAEQKTEALA